MSPGPAEMNRHWQRWQGALDTAPDPLSLAVAGLMRDQWSVTSGLWWANGRLRRRRNQFEIGVYDHTRRKTGCSVTVFS